MRIVKDTSGNMGVYKCENDYRNKIKKKQQTFDILKLLSYLDKVTVYEFEEEDRSRRSLVGSVLAY